MRALVTGGLGNVGRSCLAELLQQRHSFQDFTRDVSRSLGPLRPALRLLSPLIRWWMLRQSPYYKGRQEVHH